MKQGGREEEHLFHSRENIATAELMVEQRQHPAMGLGSGQAEGISPSRMARKGDKVDGILVLGLEGTFLQVDGGKGCRFERRKQ